MNSEYRHSRGVGRRVLLSVIAMGMALAPISCKEGTNGRDIVVIGAMACCVLTLTGLERDNENEKATRCGPCAASEKCNIHVDPPACMKHPGTMGVPCKDSGRVGPAMFHCAEGFQCAYPGKDKDIRRCSPLKKSKRGGPCSWSLDCEDKLACSVQEQGQGVCGDRIKAGGACAGRGEECAAGLECVREYGRLGVCSPPSGR